MSFVSWKHDKRWKRFKKKLSPWFETCWPNANPPLNDWTFCMWRGHNSGTERQKQFQWVYVFVFCFRFFVRRLRHFSKMSRTKLARLGKQCTGIHQYHLWSRTVVPKHSENHFGKICATFFNTVFGQPSFLGRKHIPRIHYLSAVWIVEIYCVCGRFFLVNSWGERRNVHWNNFQNQKWKPSWMKQDEKIWNFRFWAWYGPDTAALVPFFV